MQLVTVKIEKAALHPSTSKLVIEGNSLTQFDKENAVLLRGDTMKGIMQAEVDKINKQLEYAMELKGNAKVPEQYPRAAPATAPAPAPVPPYTEPEPVQVDCNMFQELLRILKATSNPNMKQHSNQLTHMEIHELLLAMKVHK